MRRQLGLLVLGLLLAGLDCVRSRGASTLPSATAVHVVVTNHFNAPVEVVAVGSGISHRLGIVHPGMVGDFVLPQAMIGGGTVELLAGANDARARSGPLLLSPGAVVDFEIANPLYNSTATVRP